MAEARKGHIPDIDDRDRFLAEEENPAMEETTDQPSRAGVSPRDVDFGEVISLGKAGNGAAEERAASGYEADDSDLADIANLQSGTDVLHSGGLDTGQDTVLYSGRAADNPNGSGRTGIKDDRS